MKKFIESEIPELAAEKCLFHVIPVPYEKTVSYGGGTAAGPEAILEASYQLEAFDGESCPCEKGIFTHPAQQTLEDLAECVKTVAGQGGIPVALGGEHTVTYGALKGMLDAGESFGVIQFDAHADLRDTYEGDKFSHACVMRRAVDDLGLPLLQIGVRALSKDELLVRGKHGVTHYDAYDIGRLGLPEELIPDGFPEKVYVTFDVDAFDSSIMPATGTPEPGGLDWWQVTQALEQIAGSRQVIGCDFVELAPISGFHAPDFTVARLIYNFMGMIARSR